MKIAKLTAEENRVWENYFAFYIDEGNDDDTACNLAWRDLQAEFEHLKAFDGCEV